MDTPYYYGIVHPLTYLKLVRSWSVRNSHTCIKNLEFVDQQTEADYHGWGING